MPYSDEVFDAVMKAMIAKVDPDKVLDIGPGAGKYGFMLRAIESDRGRPIHKICVEIDAKHVIERFALDRIYDEIIHMDAAKLVKQRPTLVGDLAIAGDVIEHMTKSEGSDLVEYLQYRFRHIFLVIPVDWQVLDWEDHEHEAHIAIWRKEDFSRFEGAYCVERRSGDGHRFLLACVNSILLPATDWFVVRDAGPENDQIEVGYFNT